jgi:hypothetical protein
VGIFAERHYQMMFPMMILTCYKSEKSKTLDTCDDSRVVAGHANRHCQKQSY